MSGHIGGGKSRVNIDFAISQLFVAELGNDSSNLYFAADDVFSISDNATGTACPLAPPPFPPVSSATDTTMLQLLLADEVMNCMSWVSTFNGALNFTLTDSDLPSGFPLRLNTTDWAVLIPQLATMYPNQLMELGISPASAPAITTDPSAGVSGAAQFLLQNSVVNKDGSLTYTHTLGLNILVGLNVSIVNAQPPATNATVLFSLSALNTTLTVVESAIGTIDLTTLDGLLAVGDPIIRSLVNAALAKGVPIPISPGLQFVDPQISYFGGFVGIGSDFTYNV